MATLGGAPPAGWPSDKLVGEIYWVRATRGEPVALYRATRIGVVVTRLPAHIVESIEPLEEHRRLRLAQALPAIAGQPTRMWPRPEHDLEAKKRSLAEACAHALAPHTKHPAIGSCRTDHQLEDALDYARRQARLRTDAGEGEIWIERIDDEERLCACALYANEQARRAGNRPGRKERTGWDRAACSCTHAGRWRPSGTSKQVPQHRARVEQHANA